MNQNNTWIRPDQAGSFSVILQAEWTILNYSERFLFVSVLNSASLSCETNCAADTQTFVNCARARLRCDWFI